MPIARILWILLRLFGLGAIVRFFATVRDRVMGAKPLPRFPPELFGDGDRSWVVFTQGDDLASTRVLDRIRGTRPPCVVAHGRPAARAGTRSRAFRVRGAPSVFLVGPDGSVRARLGDGTGLGNYVSRPA